MRLLVLGGTSDTHKFLKESGCEDFLVTVATEYGVETFSKDYGERVFHIRFDDESLPEFIRTHNITKIVDTTHPFAKNITALAEDVSARMKIPYENRMREIDLPEDFEGLHIFEKFDDAVKFLETSKFKKILLTTGANRVSDFAEIADRSVVRVLPFENSIEKCRKAGFEYKNIIGMQGPFSEEFNIALMKEIGADALVTKLSGKSGGFQEKVTACMKSSAACIVICS